MREIRTSGSEGGRGGKPPWSTRQWEFLALFFLNARFIMGARARILKKDTIP